MNTKEKKEKISLEHGSESTDLRYKKPESTQMDGVVKKENKTTTKNVE
jgi:hypothetical protein